MSLLSDILTPEDIDELYKCGFAIIPRHEDPFDIPAALIKPDWSYQWNDEAREGWHWVKYEDHPGWFAPPGTVGPVVMKGLGLFRKLKSEVDNTPEHSKRRAREQLEGWADRFGMFTGGATMLETNGEEVVRTEITAGKGVDVKVETYERPATKTVELITKVPKDMIDHVDAIFEERDRIKNQLVDVVGERSYLKQWHDKHQPILDRFWDVIENDKGAPWWPTLNAIILPYAIENVRHDLKEKANAEPAADGH